MSDVVPGWSGIEAGLRKTLGTNGTPADVAEQIVAEMKEPWRAIIGATAGQPTSLDAFKAAMKAALVALTNELMAKHAAMRLTTADVVRAAGTVDPGRGRVQ